MMRRETIVVAVAVVMGIAGAPANAAQPASKPAAAARAQAGKVDEARMAREAKIALKKIEFAIKDLTPQQREKALPIVAEYGSLYQAMEAKRDAEHQAELAKARETRTPIDLKASQVRRSLRNRQMHQLEAKYFDRIRDEVLTPQQKIKWDGYRLHLVAGFQLGMLGLKPEQNRELGALCEQVAREMPAKAGEDGYQLFQRRLSELKTRAAKQYFDDEQKKKLADAVKSTKELTRQMDELEAKEPAEAGATRPAGK